MTRRLPIADWPALDRALWEKGVEPKGLFESGGVGADWSDAFPPQDRGRLQPLAVVACDAAPRSIPTSIPPIASPPSALRPTSNISEPSARPIRSFAAVQELYDALRVMAPDADWDWLTQVYRSLRAQVRPVRDKFSRLRPIDELAALGERLMDEAETAARLVGAAARGGLSRRSHDRFARLSAGASKELRHDAAWPPSDEGRRLLADPVRRRRNQIACPLRGDRSRRRSRRGSSAISTSIDRFSFAGNVFGGATDGGPTPERGEAPIDPDSTPSGSRRSEPRSSRKRWRDRIVDHTRQGFGRSVSPHLFRDCRRDLDRRGQSQVMSAMLLSFSATRGTG